MAGSYPNQKGYEVLPASLRNGSARPRNNCAANKLDNLTPPELTTLHLTPRQ